MSTSLTARGRTGPSIKMDQNQGAVTTVPCPPKLDGPESPSSRGEVREYRQLRRKVEELVGRINGRFTDPGGDVPLHYLYRGIPHERLLAYYRLADVCLVTPLADGMNLVAKEFVTAQAAGGEAGALVLSEFTGAAVELHDALQCNPFDVDGIAAGSSAWPPPWHTTTSTPGQSKSSQRPRMRERKHDGPNRSLTRSLRGCG